MSKRFYFDSAFKADQLLVMQGKEYGEEIKHITRSLRKQVGDVVELTNGRGQLAKVEIVNIDREALSFKTLEIKNLLKDQISIVLLQSVLKGPRMDWLVEKLGELGVSELVPIISQYCVGIDPKESGEKRLGRWQRIAMSALKQSGAPSLLKISDPVSLEDFNPIDQSLKILFSFDEQAQPVGKILEKIKTSPINTVYLFVGPEGGLTTEEELFLKNKGFIFGRLGSSTLRGESAGMIACALTIDWIDFWRS